MFYMYVFFSPKSRKFYIGSTKDLKKRFESHIIGSNFSTKYVNDWQLIYYESFISRTLAFSREKSLKKRAQAWQALKKRIIDNEE